MPTHRLPSGVLTASLTPFHADYSVAQETFAHHVDWLLSHGSDGVLLFGTTGEGLSLTVEERSNGLEGLLASGVPADRLMVGTGALALEEAATLTGRATKHGVGGVLVLPPFHFRQIEENGLYRFYDELIQRVGDPGLRLYFYHFPELSGVPIPFTLIEHLRSEYSEQIAGVKDSSGEWDHTEALCSAFPDLQIFAGTERLLLPILQAGGAGCISATANLTAPLAGRVLSAWRENNDPAPLQETLTQLRTAFGPLPTIAALKYLLSTLQNSDTWSTVRPPLAPLDTDDRARADELLDDLKAAVELPTTTAGR